MARSEAKEESITALNLRIRQNTREELEVQAKAHDCFYGDKPSISKLLDKIGNREVVLYGTTENTGTETGFNVIFRMQIEDLIGTLSLVCDIFKKHNISIIGASTVSTFKESLNTTQGYGDIIVRIPKDVNIDLLKIIEEIKGLKVEDICKKYAEKGKLTKEIVSMNKLNSGDTKKQIRETDLLIPWCKCSTSIKITAYARIGLLSDLTTVIAQNEIGVLSTYRKIHESEISETHFLLVITNFESLENLIKEIRELESVKEVRKTNINQIITDFKLPI
ncbi:ACT domain-containing protein [Chamaesiphon polymorphus]|uniref:ACT domain-containing protein n=1 Tax=Chamaesiphon polymorphus CCALA 037 TaxID=2107692 RepID=A0A2T1GKH2_9CYAN|nr:ACT domain-containing protein [Chamaesiphon polymorphus]PSB58320.1 hypothetical protein C7B77_05275 [Chamaesiphon polymorphus CCALA 037]